MSSPRRGSASFGIPPRRTLLRLAALGAASVPLGSHAAADEPRRLRVGIVGLGRGAAYIKTLLGLPGVEIAWLAEVDPRRLAVAMKRVEGSQPAACRGLPDFRAGLDDPQLDCVFIALPNFWHTPAALLCLAAGKHVYVEKPGSHDIREGEWLVAAAARSGKQVQMGNQRRTWMKDAIAALHAGAIGTVRFGRGFYYASRGPVGAPRAPVAGLAADLWQGPVPDDPRHDIRQLAHYDWHWFWHWGNGELGNNGIHFLDILRWGLKAEHPLRVSYTGGRYAFADAQETPDTGTAAYDFGHAGCEWVQSSCHPRPVEQPPAEIVFYGDDGSMVINRDTWVVYDTKGVETSMSTSSVVGTGDASHIGNFLDAVRGTATLNSPIDEGQKSTRLCHLGNIAYRTGTVVRCDPVSGAILDNPAALELIGRPHYRDGWEVRA